MEKKTNSVVVLKKIFDAFQNATDAQRTFREIMYLQAMDGHENIIRLRNVIKPKDDRDFGLFLVFDYMETDLHAIIRANILEPVHKQFIVYQLLKALLFCHTGDLIHRDLKPSNLLLNEECVLKLAGFGLARSLRAPGGYAGGEETSVLTDYVATRWYRAPEVNLGSTSYDKGVDMWAVGCIIAEMFLGKPLIPGTSTTNQLECIVGVTGTPSAEDIADVKSVFAATMMKSMHEVPLRSFADEMNGASSEAIDLCRNLLTFSPMKRFSVQQALKHPYMANFFTGKEATCTSKLMIPIDDDIKYSANDYRERLYHDVLRRRKDRAARMAAYFGISQAEKVLPQ